MSRDVAGRFIDPAVLARIDNLELVARSVVHGFISGLHRSPWVGISLDFAEHRQYMPGDDIRRIDWRLFARTDRYYIKEFEAETNANCTVLLDASRSMDFGTRGITKFDYARFLAASLIHFSHRQRDRVGLVVFDTEIREFVPPSARHRDVAMHAIDRAAPGGETALEPALARVAAKLDRAGIVVVISDFYEEPTNVVRALNLLRARGNDVIVFHVLDAAELEFPYTAAANFEDAESGAVVPVVPGEFGEQYRALLSGHIEALSQNLARNQIDHVLVNTATPLDMALFRYLSDRQRLARVR